ncbi:MAG: DUF4423 domain-containing protein [Bdellovibrionaceae bacterium]|nr:DUF4423 domain-containing protein [Pseudobdellovibrionaceae bacterium]
MDIKSVNIFDFVDYKRFLASLIGVNGRRRGLYKELAMAANCQPSYLSQVMRKGSKIQLTPDQTLGIAQMLLLSPKERDYFLYLVDYERASSKELKGLLSEKIKSMQKSSLDIGNILDRPKSENQESLVKFYSSWLFSYIHILTSIPEFQSTESISQKINLPGEATLNILSELENMGLVKREKGLWLHSGRHLHVDAESTLVGNHHNNWRQQAMLDTQLKNSIESVHFSGVYSVSKSDFSKIKTLVLESLKNLNALAISSGTEEVVVFCCDLFKK